ncbi:cytochrome P450 [Aspergillus similis]
MLWILIKFWLTWLLSGWIWMYLNLLWGPWLTRLEFIVDGAGMIADVYRRPHSPFAIPALSEYQTLVSKHIKEVGRCSEHVLSFNDAMEKAAYSYHQRLRHKYTMFGFDDKGIDPNHSLVGRVLKVHLRTAIPALHVDLQIPIRETMRHLVSQGKVAVLPGWKEIRAASFARQITARVNNQMLVGDRLAASSRFHDATLRYNQDVALTMEICRHILSMLVPVVATAVMGWSGAMEEVVSCLTSLIEERLREDPNCKCSKKVSVWRVWVLFKPMPLLMRDWRRDCVHWIMVCSQRPEQRTTRRLVQQTIALMFASAHQIPMALAYAIYDLCVHPQYISPLRQEIDHARRTKAFKDQFNHMPLMDSFLKESARLSPLDALSIQRLARVPYSFPDNGPHVPAGNLVAVPQEAVMKDPLNYVEAEVFDGFRFVVTDGSVDQEDAMPRPCPKFTDVSWKSPYWGSEKKPVLAFNTHSPGRWYVSSILKQILTNLIMDYDFKLAHENTPRSFIWTTAIIPHFKTTPLI